MKFLFGVGLGFVVGMIVAPAPGTDSRRRLAQTVRGWVNAPRERMEEKVDEIARKSEQKAGDVGSEVGRKAAEAAVRAVREEVIGSPENKTA